MIRINDRPSPASRSVTRRHPNRHPDSGSRRSGHRPFAGLGVGYALSSPGHRVWPMVAGFLPRRPRRIVGRDRHRLARNGAEADTNTDARIGERS